MDFLSQMKKYIFTILFLFVLLVSCSQKTTSETKDAKTELLELLSTTVDTYSVIYEAEWTTGGSHNKSYHINIQNGNIISYEEYSFNTPIPTYCEEIYSAVTETWTTCHCGAKYIEKNGMSVHEYVEEGIVGGWQDISCPETPPEEVDVVQKKKISEILENTGIQSTISFTNTYGTCYFVNTMHVFCFRDDGLLVFMDELEQHPYLLYLQSQFDGIRAWDWPEIIDAKNKT